MPQRPMLSTLLLTTTIAATAAPAAAAESGALADARRAYEAMDYDRVIEFLDRDEEEQRNPSDERAFRELKALTYAIYDKAEAVDAFVGLLEIDPAYTLPPGTSPKIAEKLRWARVRRPAPPTKITSPPPIYERWWFWAGVGVVATSVAIVVTVGVRGDSDDTPHDLGPYRIPASALESRSINDAN